ncbi:MAG: thioredoxin domain-containing protein [Acidobacteria bacterium]|nr:thioredoxin domain-containing protein [Acidobacteriota bacterium]
MLDLPLERIHPLAFQAAVAVACAGDQDRYWEMHDRLFANQRQLEPWSGHAEAIELDVATFDDCMESGRHDAGVRRDMKEAAKAGITGTPGFLLAVADPEDPSKVKGLSTLRGAQPFNVFKTQLDGALRELAKQDAQPVQARGATQ